MSHVVPWHSLPAERRGLSVCKDNFKWRLFWQGGNCIIALEKNLDKTLGFMILDTLTWSKGTLYMEPEPLEQGAQQREPGGQSIRCKNLLHHRKFRRRRAKGHYSHLKCMFKFGDSKYSKNFHASRSLSAVSDCRYCRAFPTALKCKLVGYNILYYVCSSSLVL